MRSSAVMASALDARPFLRLRDRERGRDGQGRVFPLIYGDNVIGRDADVGVFIDLPDVSRRHALLRVTSEGATVEDLGSKNGVTIGGAPIRGVATLVHGATFALGDVLLEMNHPGSQVAEALARAGETTVTRASRRLESAPEPELSLRWPLLATIVFAAVVAALLWGVGVDG